MLLDKVAGRSSNACLKLVKKIFNVKKCGYAGTLDPFATGLLVVGCGKATKLLHNASNMEKEYLFCVKFGEETDSGDIDGKIIAKKQKDITIDDVKKEIKTNFIGVINQIPPIYSALKKNGKRLCDLAREGCDGNILDAITKEKTRQVEIITFDTVYWDGGNVFDFRVLCSKGTYIRKLAVDLARNLGTFGHVVSLRRVSVGPFNLTSSEYNVLNLSNLANCNVVDGKNLISSLPLSNFIINLSRSDDVIRKYKTFNTITA